MSYYIRLIGLIVFIFGVGHMAAASNGDKITKDWTAHIWEKKNGGMAYPTESRFPQAKSTVIGIACKKRARNIYFFNPAREVFAGNKKMMAKIEILSKSPILMFNDSTKEYKLQLGYWKKGDPNTKIHKDSTLTLPNGTLLKGLDALKKIKNMLMANSTVWIGYENPETGNTSGRVYSLSGSTAAINYVYKIGSCNH